MPTTINHGGPAFPYVPTDRSGQIGPSDPGMSLRDWFAGKAMHGLLASWGHHDVTDFSEIAIDAYTIADAMLQTREVPSVSQN